MPQHQKHVQHLESDGRYGKEVDRHQILTWLSRNVRQVCEGGLRRRTMYLATVVSLISMPSLSNSPWMWGAPQSTFSRLILRIRSRISQETAGRPTRPCRIFQVQKRRNPLRCQAIAVAGLTMSSAEAPVAPDPGEEHPKQTVGGSQLRPFPGRTLKDPNLVAESHVFQLQHSA